MGCCLRTGAHLTLDLPSIFWKQIVCQDILLEDLEETDKFLVETIYYLQNVSEEEYEEPEWTVQQSDKTMLELIPDGTGKTVPFA